MRELNLEEIRKYSSPEKSEDLVREFSARPIRDSKGNVIGYAPKSGSVPINKDGVPNNEFEEVYNEDGTYAGSRLKEESIKKIADELIRSDIRSRLGVNLVVDESLSNPVNKIKFISGSSGGMQGALAYIQYWSRNGTNQRTPVKQDPVSGSESFGEVSSTADGIEEVSSGAVRPQPEQQPAPTAAPPPSIPVNVQSRPDPGSAAARQRNFDRARARRPAKVETGQVYKANPGAVAPKTKTQDQEYNRFDDSLPGKWQFLFNPEELQLESGPDYNKAETWGVSDPANSGQPLSWRSNKNRRLTFGKVLLTGYVIGKRVDSLEKGLQELFMARDGENGNDGPPVLEFVWGSRIFGPCVIQDIRVTEKAWDHGILVNAEVSFSLEQVPEWTINDGFVDIARPGRQSTISDPALPKPAETGDTGVDPTIPAVLPPPPNTGGKSNEQNAREYKARRCQRAFFYTGDLAKLRREIEQFGKDRSGGFGGDYRTWERWLSRFLTTSGSISTELSVRFDAASIQKEWDDLKKKNDKGFFSGGINIGVRRNFLLSEIIETQNVLISIWDNKTECPNTAGKGKR